MIVLDYKIYSNQQRLLNNTAPVISILIGFYNNIRCFEIQMASLEQQTLKNFEVLICDDGSRPEVIELIHAYMKKAPFIIKHLWQADEGWRKTELLNKALLACESEYVVLVDQDCILHPEFLREHYLQRDEKIVLSGRRAELPDFISQKITAQNVKQMFIQKNYWWFLFFMFFRKDNQWFKGLYFRSSFLRKIFNRKKRAIVGCNYSAHLKNFKLVNGFDMTYQRPCGAEDTDIGWRFKNLGLDTKSVCHQAVQYHLWHPLRKEPIEIPPEYLANETSGLYKTKNGLHLISPVEKLFV